MRDYLEDAESIRESAKKTQAPERQLSADGASPNKVTERHALTPGAVIGMQRSVGNAGTAAYLDQHQHAEEEKSASPVHQTIAGGGTPLDKTTRASMEDHLKTDFSDVRLHVDAKSAESVKAAAYTVGNDIVVHPSHFQPGSVSTQRTLAHELTHVKQQREGPVDGTPAAGGIRISDPSDRFERAAESSASAFVSSRRAPATESEEKTEAPQSDTPVQRQAEEEDEEETEES